MTPWQTGPMDEQLLVACLCAAWCTTCAAYRPVLAEVAALHPDKCFAWIDIEDDADALGDDALDITTFPTVMVLRAGQPLFHGSLPPHAATLSRLLHALAGGGSSANTNTTVTVPPAMAAAVWRLGAQRPLLSG